MVRQLEEVEGPEGASQNHNQAPKDLSRMLRLNSQAAGK
jgi:hypothetical protein